MSSERNTIWQQAVAKLQDAENQSTEITQPVVAQLRKLHLRKYLPFISRISSI